MSTFSNVLLFQGQNMDFRKIYAESEYVRQKVAAMQPFCSISIEKVCKEAPGHDLFKTMYEQPAIFAVSMARLMEDVPEWEQGEFRGVVVGHSFGECAALCASGVLTLENGMCVAEARGKYTALANYEYPGSMAVVMGSPTLSLPEIYSACREYSIDVGGINTPDQAILTGPEQRVEQACRTLERRGLRIFPLNIGGAFHSHLMRKAQEKFRLALREIKFSPPNPQTPIIMNASFLPETNPEVIKNCLAKQLTDPVDFPRVVKTLDRFSVSNFLEIGAKKILSGFIKKIRANQTPS